MIRLRQYQLEADRPGHLAPDPDRREAAVMISIGDWVEITRAGRHCGRLGEVIDVTTYLPDPDSVYTIDLSNTTLFLFDDEFRKVTHDLDPAGDPGLPPGQA